MPQPRGGAGCIASCHSVGCWDSSSLSCRDSGRRTWRKDWMMRSDRTAKRWRVNLEWIIALRGSTASCALMSQPAEPARSVFLQPVLQERPLLELALGNVARQVEQGFPLEGGVHVDL